MLNPPGAVDAAIFRFLRNVGHVLENLIDNALDAELHRRQRNAGPQWSVSLMDCFFSLLQTVITNNSNKN